MDTDNTDLDKTNLIVNYLPQQMTDEQFEELFKNHGSMKSCKIVRNRSSGYSYGFGFVDYESHESALKAIGELNGQEIDNKKIKVAFARPAGQDIKQANLYIKNVPVHWEQDDVRKVFEPYGDIIQVRVLDNNRGIAFVLFDLRKQAEDALEALNGKKLDGCEEPFEIKFAADKKVEKNGNKNINTSTSDRVSTNTTRRSRAGRNRNRDHQRQGRHQNQKQPYDHLTNNNSNYNNNNDDRFRGQYAGGLQYNNNMNGGGPIRHNPNRNNRFAPFVAPQQPIGQVQAGQTPMVNQLMPNPAFSFQTQQQMIPFAMIPAQAMPQMQPLNQIGGAMTQAPLTMYNAPQMSLGYAPIAPTQNAMSTMYNMATNNINNPVTIQPQTSQSSSILRNMSANSGRNNGVGPTSGDDGVTLFVYNIGPDSDEKELRGIFSPYGQVVRCNVVRKTPGGETKGFGFVTFGARDEANAAITGLNGIVRNGRTLQVSLKK